MPFGVFNSVARAKNFSLCSQSARSLKNQNHSALTLLFSRLIFAPAPAPLSLHLLYFDPLPAPPHNQFFKNYYIKKKVISFFITIMD